MAIRKGTIGGDTLSGGEGFDVIYSGTGDDYAYGGAGDDTLYGDAGRDTLFGGLGNDLLNGGLGADIMDGGAGNDTYVVDDAGDVVVEADGGGIDLVKASVSYRLSDWVENLTLLGGGALDGGGNALANTIKGGDGANRLEGLGGNDSLDGGAGDDVLIGGAGSDLLRGGLGADRFVFAATDQAAGVATDSVTDLNFADGDRLVFTGFGAAGEAVVASYAELAAFVAATPGASIVRRDSAGVTQVVLASANGAAQLINIADKSGAGTAWTQYQAAVAASAPPPPGSGQGNSGQPPVANADVARTTQQASILADVLANDRDDAPGLTLISATIVSGGGTVAIENGKVRFATGDAFRHLAADVTAPVAIDYVVRDASGLTATGRLAVTVTGTNDAPLIVSAASDSTGAVREAGWPDVAAAPDAGIASATGRLASADVDDTATAIWSGNADGLYGRFAIDAATGQWTYMLDNARAATNALAAGVIATDRFIATVTDDKGATATRAVDVTVTGTNDAPVLLKPTADQTIAEDSGLWSFALPTGAFGDADAATLKLTALQADGKPLPAWLALVFDTGTPRFVGTPPQDFNGAIDIRLVASDGQRTASDDFTLTVTPVADAPVARDDTVTLREDEPQAIDLSALLANDSDPDGDRPVFGSAFNAVNGTLSSTANAPVLFTPVRDFNGTAGFDYMISDGKGGTATAHVTIDVRPAPDAPVIVTPLADQTIAEDSGKWTFRVPPDAFADVDHDRLYLSLASADTRPLPGWITYESATGEIGGTPPKDFSGTVAIRVFVRDSLSSGTFIIKDDFTLTVTPVEDAPVAVDDRIVVGKGTPTSIAYATLLANDYDPDGDTLTFGGISNVTHAVAVPFIGNTLFYWPDSDFVGEAGFDYTVSDGHGHTTQAHVTVEVSDALRANDDRLFMAEDDSLIILPSRLLDNDISPSGTTRTLAGLSNVTDGTLVENPIFAGTYIFRPDANFSGVAGFDYTVSDGRGHTDVGHVAVTVNPVNDAPVAVNDRVSVNQGSSVIILASTLFANDSDSDENDVLSLTGVSNVTGGSTFKFGDTVTFTPTLGNSIGGYDYTVGDGNGGTATAHVTVAINSAPVATDTVFFGGKEDEITRIWAQDVLGAAFDIDGDQLVVQSVEGVHDGVPIYEDSSDVYIVFKPDPNFNGVAEFRYTVADPGGLTSTATIHYYIDAVQDYYIAVDDHRDAYDGMQLYGENFGDYGFGDNDINNDNVRYKFINNSSQLVNMSERFDLLTLSHVYEIIDPSQPAAIRYTVRENVSGHQSSAWVYFAVPFSGEVYPGEITPVDPGDFPAM